jgi:uncharacterized protein (DUF924 family)
MQWIDDVIAFWFDELRPKDWWSAAPDVDETIRERFGTVREVLMRDQPELATLDGRGHLATVIVFDQFPRNLFRDSAEAFATDPLALAATIDALDRRLDIELDEPQRQFLYMPLLHSEDPERQQRSLLQFATLSDRRAFKSAKDHHDTIARFGRFPYRNAALGRASTEAELAFLAKHPEPE